MVVVMNTWIVTAYPSAPWKRVCSTCHSFPFLCRLPWPWLFMWHSPDVSTTAEHACPTSAPGPCSIFFSVEFELLICFCYFVCIIFITLCSLLCISFFHLKFWRKNRFHDNIKSSLNLNIWNWHVVFTIKTHLSSNRNMANLVFKLVVNNGIIAKGFPYWLSYWSRASHIGLQLRPIWLASDQ